VIRVKAGIDGSNGVAAIPAAMMDTPDLDDEDEEEEEEEEDDEE